MVQQLLEKEAPMKEIKINPEKLQTSRKKKRLESFLAQDQQI